MTNILSQDDLEGNLWEFGVLLPFRNNTFDSYEKHTTLARRVNFESDIAVERSETILILSPDPIDNLNIHPDQTIFIGPSTNKEKDSSGNFLYRGNVEKRKIDEVTVTEFPTGTISEIKLKKFKTNENDTLDFKYEVGDQVTFRGVANAWNIIRLDDIHTFSDKSAVAQFPRGTITSVKSMAYTTAFSVDNGVLFSDFINRWTSNSLGSGTLIFDDNSTYTEVGVENKTNGGKTFLIRDLAEHTFVNNDSDYLFDITINFNEGNVVVEGDVNSTDNKWAFVILDSSGNIALEIGLRYGVSATKKLEVYRIINTNFPFYTGSGEDDDIAFTENTLNQTLQIRIVSGTPYKIQCRYNNGVAPTTIGSIIDLDGTGTEKYSFGFYMIARDNGTDVGKISVQVDTIGLGAYPNTDAISDIVKQFLDQEQIYIERTEPLYRPRGFSQKFHVGYEAEDYNDDPSGGSGFSSPISVNTIIGVLQDLPLNKLAPDNFILGKNIRLSGWYKTDMFTGSILPTLALALYDNPTAIPTNESQADFIESDGETELGQDNIFLSDIIAISSSITALNARIACYGLFGQDGNSAWANGADLVFDYVMIEHAVGTCSEDDGYITSPVTPKIGMSFSLQQQLSTTRLITGDKTNDNVADNNIRYNFTALFQTVDKSFIDDMITLENWNRKGYKIAVRPNMFGIFPPVLICDITVKEPKFLEGSRGSSIYDLEIEFNEVLL